MLHELDMHIRLLLVPCTSAEECICPTCRVTAVKQVKDVYSNLMQNQHTEVVPRT